MERKAFTLIELLVVMAVIGCLIALVVPCMRYSKSKAQSVVCTSNLGQLGIQLNSYANFQGIYPPGFCNLPEFSSVPPGGYIGNASIDCMGWWWFHFLVETKESSFTIKKMISCPSSKITFNPDLNTLCGNYGINYSICKIASLTSKDEFRGRSLGPSSIRRLAQNILVTDSGYGLISRKAATLDPPCTFEWPARQNVYYIPGLSINSSKVIYPDLRTDAQDGRHPNRTLNIITADGAAKKIPAEDLLIPANTSLQSSSAYLIWSPLSKL